MVNKVNSLKGYKLNYSLKNLTYSAPSDPTDPIIAKPRRLAPHIHREDLEDRVVKVGQDAKFNVHVDGMLILMAS